MKKTSILFFCAFAQCMSVYAQTSEDTILIQGRDIPEVSIIAKVEQPADTRKKLSNEQLTRENTGQN